MFIEKDIPTVAIVKDSMANKYFLSLYHALKGSKQNFEADSDFF